METEYQRVRRIREEPFQASLKRRDSAAAHFYKVRNDLPGVIPYPENTQRISNVSAKYSAAFQAVTRAVERTSDFQRSKIERVIGAAAKTGLKDKTERRQAG